MDSISAPSGRSLLVGSVSVRCDRLRQMSWSPRSVSMRQHVKLPDVSPGTCLRDNLIAEEHIIINQPTQQTIIALKVKYISTHDRE